MKIFLSSIFFLLTCLCFGQEIKEDSLVMDSVSTDSLLVDSTLNVGREFPGFSQAFGIDTNQIVRFDSAELVLFDSIYQLLDSSLISILNDDSLSLDSMGMAYLDSLGLMGDSIMLNQLTAYVQQQLAEPIEVGPSYKVAKGVMEDDVLYHSSDSIRFDVNSQKALLYGDAEVTFDGTTLRAEVIEIDWVKNNVIAYGQLDSAGNLYGIPEFTDGSQNFKAEQIIYNYETEKGNITNLYSQDGESFIHGSKVRKTPENNMLIKGGRYTTCSLEDHPHFYISLNKMKVIPEKTVVAKGANLVLNGVPTPLWIPFGVFPINNARSSGILMPSYGNNPQFGYSLNGAGYYFGISDYMDVKVFGDVYTKGKYEVNVHSRFRKRYRYNGNVQINYGVTPLGDPLSLDYTLAKDFFIRGNYKLEPTARPGVNLNSSIEFGTSSYHSLNELASDEFLKNNMRSSLSFNKKINRKMRLTSSLRHNQNRRGNMVNFQLPYTTYSISRINVKDVIKTTKNNPITKIGATYNLGFRNKIDIPDTVLFKRWMDDDIITNSMSPAFIENDSAYRAYIDAPIEWNEYMKYGFQHQMPISTNFKLSYFNFRPSFNVKQRLYFDKREMTWDDTSGVGLQGLVHDTTFNRMADGSFRHHSVTDYNMSVSMNTAIYGTFKFRRGNLRAIRHTIRPTISYTYMPDFSAENYGYYGRYERPKVIKEKTEDGRDTFLVSRIDTIVYSQFNGVYGAPPKGERSTLTLAINNLFEGKRIDTTQKDGFSRFKIIDNISMSGSYNFAADSNQLSTIRSSFRTTVPIFKRQLRVNIQMVHDPYYNDSSNRRRSKMYWFDRPVNDKTGDLYNQEEKKLARFQSMNSSFSLSINEKGKKKGEDGMEPGFIDPYGRYYYWDELYYDVVYGSGWRVDLRYSLRVNNRFVKDPITSLMVDSNVITQTFNPTIDLGLTDRWNLRIRTGYDFTQREIAYTRLTASRDLHCFEMRMDWVPFGRREMFLFTFRVKSSLLQDLKFKRDNYAAQQNYDTFD